MESGLRQDRTSKIRPHNIVTRFGAHLGTACCSPGSQTFPSPQNHYIEFTFLARERGELRHWKDGTGQTASASKAISVS